MAGSRLLDRDDLDLSLASLFAGWALADELARRLAADGFADARFADGVVIQHLIGSPIAIGPLAERLGVSQQAASKSVADLERRGYARRVTAADRRRHLVALSERGRSAVERSRVHRAAIAAELSERLGKERTDAARALLIEVIDSVGDLAALSERRARPPR